MQVCSTEFVYHALFNPQDGMVESILANGLRPLSDFPESERWQQIQAEMPGFFETLYNNFAKPVIQRPYQNAGVFVSPIDFRLLPGTYLYDKPRFRIPISRIDPATACLTYEWESKRSRLPLTVETLAETAALWTEDRVRAWFAKDQSKVFYYVPQLMVYPVDGIPIEPEDIEYFD